MKRLEDKDFVEIEKLHNIYSDEMPSFMKEIIMSKEMQRLKHVGQNCGRDYISNNLNTFNYNYSRLNHSIGVGLIVWNFTKNKTQAIAGLLHDIATPTFSHVIDYYNNDSETQTSTESKTEEIIKKSIEINNVLRKHDIKIEEVSDYEMYSIADNKMPQLSADRLEYTIYMGTSRGIITMEEAKEIYNDIVIVKNEFGQDEMCFQNIELAKKMTKVALDNGKYMSGDISTITNNYLSDVLKMAVKSNILLPEMFYEKSEEEIVEILDGLRSGKIKENWDRFKSFEKIYTTNEELKGRYTVKATGKKRYINPLIKTDINGNINRVTYLDKELEIEVNDFLKENPIYYSI